MASREKATGRSLPAKPRRGGADGNGKTTDRVKLTATAQPKPVKSSTRPSEAAVVQLHRRRAAATKSTTSAPQRGPRLVESMPPPKPSRTGRASAPDKFAQRDPDSAVPSRLVRTEAAPAKPAVRKRRQDRRSPASAHSRSTTPNRTRRPPVSAPESSGPTEAPRGRVWRSVEAVVDWLKTHVHHLLDAVRDGGEALTSKVQEWMDTLVEAVANGGAGVKAGLAGLRAVLAGKNPVLAAIKSLVSGLSGKAKVAIILLLVFGLLLGPVLLVVLLLALVVGALIAAVRGAAE
jgi:hypothetical protein